MPGSLQSLSFGERFNQSLDRVTLPSGLQSLTFGPNFNEDLEKVKWPSNLKSLTFSGRFNKRMRLPSSLHSVTCGARLVSIV